MNYINYINYISFIIMVTSNHFLKSKFKNYQRWHLLGRTSGGFCDVDLHFVVVVILHLLMFFIHIFFSTSSLTLPWTIARFLDPFCAFSPAHCRVIRNTFIFNYSVIFLPRALRFWVGIFYPQAFFTLRSFPTFWHDLLLSRLPWEPAVIPQNLQGFILILETQNQPICLFDSQ